MAGKSLMPRQTQETCQAVRGVNVRTRCGYRMLRISNGTRGYDDPIAEGAFGMGSKRQFLGPTHRGLAAFGGSAPFPDWPEARPRGVD
jgi:hypothetical protein